MKKIKYSILFVCFMMVAGLMVSCNKDEKASGNVELISFGPSPIPRGGELRILGKNLDKVESVTLPGSGDITSFTMKTPAEIRLIVPKSAEYGKIVLKSGKSEITSLSNLGIDGSIGITSFSPLTAKAGDVITIVGDDLDFVNEVIFTSGVVVLSEDFVSRTVGAIEVILPLEAQTGLVAVSDGAESMPIVLYFEEDLNVVLPTITSFSPGTIKAGNELTITGIDFELVESITFGGNRIVESFSVNEAKTSITVTVPNDAQDGAIVFTAFSGVKVNSVESLIMLVPTITSISPNPVNAGGELTVTGTDLDLINKVTFGGSRVGDIVAGGTATQIIVTVPESAKDGKVIFTTRANKDVEFDEVLVVKQVGNTVTIPLWEGSMDIDWWPNIVEIKGSEFADIPAGAIMTFIFEQKAAWGQVKICDGSWAELPFPELGGAYIKTDSYNDKSVTTQELQLTQDILDKLIATNGLILQGENWIFTGVTVTITVGGGPEPVADPELIIFDFDERNADLWGVGTIPSPNNDGPSGNFYEVMAPPGGTWAWGFASNGAAFHAWLPEISGKENYVLKMDVMLRNDVTVSNSYCILEFQMAGKNVSLNSELRDGNVFSTGGKWITITLQLPSELPDPTPKSGDWGLIFNQGTPIADFTGLCIDNVRYHRK